MYVRHDDLETHVSHIERYVPPLTGGGGGLLPKMLSVCFIIGHVQCICRSQRRGPLMSLVTLICDKTSVNGNYTSYYSG